MVVIVVMRVVVVMRVGVAATVQETVRVVVSFMQDLEDGDVDN